MHLGGKLSTIFQDTANHPQNTAEIAWKITPEGRSRAFGIVVRSSITDGSQERSGSVSAPRCAPWVFNKFLPDVCRPNQIKAIYVSKELVEEQKVLLGVFFHLI
jgi:hypothetical protein